MKRKRQFKEKRNEWFLRSLSLRNFFYQLSDDTLADKTLRQGIGQASFCYYHNSKLFLSTAFPLQQCRHARFLQNASQRQDRSVLVNPVKNAVKRRQAKTVAGSHHYRRNAAGNCRIMMLHK